MSVVQNTLSEIGDSVLFKMSSPIIGIDRFTGFTDEVVGETLHRTLRREFRYTLDAVNYTGWMPLDGTNVTTIQIQPNYYFQAEYRYTRTGSTSGGLIIFNWVRLDYETSVDCIKSHYFDLSIYKYFYDCMDHNDIKSWCVNVLKKLYFPGVLPISMTRGENRNRNQEDRDFIDFWSTISCYFSLVVNYARSFGKIFTDHRLLRRFLQQQDLIVGARESLEDLQYLARNTYSEFSKRGTIHISEVNENKPDGELLRLIQYDSRIDEFIFESSYYLWNLDEHSPMYKGIYPTQCFKGYSKGEIELANYPIINPTKVSLVPEGYETVMKITGVENGEVAGIGFDNPNTPTVDDIGFLFNVDARLTYELSFMVRGNARFSVRGYGYSSAITKAHPTLIVPEGIGNTAILQQRVVDNGEWYWVRVLFYSFDELSTGTPDMRQTSLGVGNNLRIPRIMVKAGFEISVDRRTLIHQNPTVSNMHIEMIAGQSRVIQLSDLNQDFNDMDGEVLYAVTINSVDPNPTGGLFLDGTEVVTPQDISLVDVVAQKLVYVDSSPDNTNIYIEIKFTPITGSPRDSLDNDYLLIKNINFKLAKREYGIGVTNGIPLVETWMVNRSGRSKGEIHSTISNSLIPYNMLNYNNLIDE